MIAWWQGLPVLSSDAVAIIGFAVLFLLMLLRVPVGMAMGLVGVTGFGYLVGSTPALKLVGQTSMRTVTDYTFGVIPMFLLMGAFVTTSGMSRELFRAANALIGHRRGGLGFATIVSCGAFAAISGSSVATAATFSTVAYPEMRRYGYPQSFATGVIAAGGTLGAMLPPSTVLAVYGIITEQDIGKLFIAGIVPGILAMLMYMLTISIIGAVRPGFLPQGPRAAWRERLQALGEIWAPLLLFVFVIGGLYGLPFLPKFTPTEAGGVGAAGAFIIGVLRGRLSHEDVRLSLRRAIATRTFAVAALVIVRALIFREGRLSRQGIRDSLLQATRTAAAVFTVLIGALLFGYFLTVTQTPQKVTAFLTGLGLGRYGVLALILAMYLVLGCLMDAMAMIILTIPIIFPVIMALGFDPIWFGIIIVMTVELGLIHPPVGMIVFVIKSVIQDVSFSTIFRGVIPFVITDLLRLVILIALPVLATYLPSHM
jgi:tripartite ATP-independent transporter DctM subunit